MRKRIELLASSLLLLGTPAVAQPVPNPVPPTDGDQILVTGRRGELSNWRMAETSHLVVVSNGSESELIRIARNLERLHFLLAGLLGQPDTVDDKVKLRITLIGDVAQFQAMDLRASRWQQGPFAEEFQSLRYYDPREDGAVLATTRVDQKVVLEQGVSMEVVSGILRSNPSIQNIAPPSPISGFGASALEGLSDTSDLANGVNQQAFSLPADYLLYSSYAQHFLTSYFPAAYPRWYVDGFGQMFATLETRGNTVLEYGRSPVGTSATLGRFADYPLKRVLDGSYLAEKPSRTHWTPTHAWLLTHFLFFSDKRRPQLNRYLLAHANGATPEEAGAAFGDLDELARELRRYYRGKKPYEQIKYPAERSEEPLVRRLTRSEAAFVAGRLELGSRVELAGVSPNAGRWLARLREDAARYPAEPEAQLLLSEAECRSGHAAECLSAAERTLVLRPNESAALAWKGMALTQLAAGRPDAERQAMLRGAQVAVGAANKADTNAVLPLLAYHRLMSAQVQPAPALAVDALAGALARVPNAPATRVALGAEMVARGADGEARRTLMPVAFGPWISPERAKARELLKRAEP
jgi:hypothetical protein